MRSVDYVHDLFDKKDYHTLEYVLHPLDRFVFNESGGWGTLLFWAMFDDETRLFQYIISTHGIQIMEEEAEEDESGWEALFRLLHEAGCGDRQKMALFEILLDEDAEVAEARIEEDEWTDLYLSSAWGVSQHEKRRALPAAVWCCKAIRSEGADGLEETLGKRLQAASTWDWEPKMKRCKY